MDVAADVAAAAVQVEQDIGHELARPVIGVLPAAAAGIDRKAGGIEQIGRLCADTRCIKRGMLQQPNEFGRMTGANGLGARLHLSDGEVIRHRSGAEPPLKPARLSQSIRPGAQILRKGQYALVHGGNIRFGLLRGDSFY